MKIQLIKDLLIQKRHQINNPGFMVTHDMSFCLFCDTATVSSVIRVCDDCYNKIKSVFEEES